MGDNGVGGAGRDEGNACDNPVGPSPQGYQHIPGLLIVGGFAEDTVPEAYDGVGGEDVCVGAEPGDDLGLGEGDPVGNILGPG